MMTGLFGIKKVDQFEDLQIIERFFTWEIREDTT